MKNQKPTLLLLLLLSCNAYGEMYKCVIDGKPSFSERPCAPNAQKISSGDGSISKERQEQAAEVARREQSMAREIEMEKRSEALERQMRYQLSQPSARDGKQARCDKLVQTAKDAKNEAAMYRYHGGLIDDARRRQKEAEDAHFSECYSAH